MTPITFHRIPLTSGAEAYRRDNPDDAKVILYDSGHFALETHAAEIGGDINAFLQGLFH